MAWRERRRDHGWRGTEVLHPRENRMLKSRIRNLAIAAITIGSAAGLTALAAPGASAATAAPATQAVARAATPSSAAANSARTTTRASVVREAAVPDTSPVGCTYGSSSGNVQTCFQIVGSYTYVDYMAASACVVNSGRTLHIEITGPSFTENSTQEYVSPGYCLDFTVTVNGDVDAGQYHAITWRYNGGSSYTNIGEVTWSVVA